MQRVKEMQAVLILENGRIFRGTSMGSAQQRVFEAVFNTSMMGYQEVLTDPSNAGQGIVMTYPLIGNYGFNGEDNSSDQVWAEAMIVRHLSPRGSNFRCEGTLDDYLKAHNVTGICGVDTRAITRALRDCGTMNAMITTNIDIDIDEALAQIRAYRIEQAVERVTGKEIRHYAGEGPKVALMDYGLKAGILASLLDRGCDVTVYPAATPAQAILDGGYAGVVLGNGPGDPAQNPQIITEVKKLYEANVPMLGIDLGHQLLALATGAKTEKHIHGHHGGNHPVRDLKLDRVYITSQNHNYCVAADSVDPAVAEVSHINVNDGSVEGLSYKNGLAETVQFLPEAAKGTQNSPYVYDNFVAKLGGDR